MVETRTARLSLPQWSSGATDGPSREDFNEAFGNIEKWAARFEYGPLASRRAPLLADTYWVDETGTIYRDTGTAWEPIGSPRNALNIVKESGTAPAIRTENPQGFEDVDAIRTVHAGKNRFRVTGDGHVLASSARIWPSDAAAPASTYPGTFALATRSGAHAGVSVFGSAGQASNLLETKTSGGADLTQLTASGDVYTANRGSIGSLAPADSQLFVKGSQDARPEILVRGSNPSLHDGPTVQVQNSDGTVSLLKLDGRGRLAVGNRNNPAQLTGDVLALNTNATAQNNGATAQDQARLVFRNTSAGSGVAGLQTRQEPGDRANTASLGIFAGTSPDGAQAPERVRFGITPDKHGARFTSADDQWTPVVVRGTPGQTAPLVALQRGDGTNVAQFGPDGTLTARKVVSTSTDPSTMAGDLTVNGKITGQSLRAIQGSSTEVGVVSQIKAAAAAGSHFVAQDEQGVPRARINRDGTLEIGMDTNAVNPETTLLTMRGRQYRQNGKKLQAYDAEAGKWGSFESAFGAEYYATTRTDVDNSWTAIPWGGEANDTENAFTHLVNSPKVVVPFTGWYDVRALSHVTMNFTGSGAGTFRINNVLEMKYRRDFPRALGFDVVTIAISDLVFLNAGDSIEFMVKIDSFLFNVRTLNSGDYRSRMSLRFTGHA